MNPWLAAAAFLLMDVPCARAQWQQQVSGTDANFRGHCIVRPSVAFALTGAG